MFLFFFSFFMQPFVHILLYVLLLISSVFNYFVSESPKEILLNYLKVEIKFEALRSFCELQITFDQTQMHSSPAVGLFYLNIYIARLVHTDTQLLLYSAGEYAVTSGLGVSACANAVGIDIHKLKPACEKEFNL